MDVKGENYESDFGSLIIYSKYKMRYLFKIFYEVINLPYGFIFEFIKVKLFKITKCTNFES